MKKIFLIVNVIPIFFLLQSCTKDKANQYMWNDFQNCHLAQHLDSTAIANKLIGNWILRSSFCGECIDPGSHAPSKTVTVSFTSDRSFIIAENSAIVDHGHWCLQSGNVNYWQLSMDSPGRYLYGDILFCENQVMFADSYIDGSDNLFERIK